MLNLNKFVIFIKAFGLNHFIKRQDILHIFNNGTSSYNEATFEDFEKILLKIAETIVEDFDEVSGNSQNRKLEELYAFL